MICRECGSGPDVHIHLAEPERHCKRPEEHHKFVEELAPRKPTASEILLGADPSEEWVADAWSEL